MSNILLKVENAGAERLWNYILAYRRMISQTDQISMTNSVTIGLMPAAEQTKPLANRKRNLKNSV